MRLHNVRDFVHTTKEHLHRAHTIILTYQISLDKQYEVNKMSYVGPKVKTQFESLSIDLKNEILSRNVHLETMNDLISVLEQIVNEG